MSPSLIVILSEAQGGFDCRCRQITVRLRHNPRRAVRQGWHRLHAKDAQAILICATSLRRFT